MRTSSSTRLHLGCFDRPVDGWLNTDVTPHLRIAQIPFLPRLLRKVGAISEERAEQHERGVFRAVHYLDVTRPFPYDSGHFEAVFCSHLLEHLFPGEAESCAKEVFRVLRSGGIFRVSVPDLDRCVAEFDAGDPDAFCDGVFESRQRRNKNQHHWMYNALSMSRLLQRAGFENVRRVEFQVGDCPDLERLDNRPHSLFMEATK